MALILKGRAKLKGSTVVGKRPYAIDGVFNPELVLDFVKDHYRTQSVTNTRAGAITHTRASTATYVDSTGTLQTAAINEPRLGHHVYNGTAWVNEGLLHESEARTNFALGSNTPADTTYWSTTDAQNGITHTVIGTGVENGAAYLDVRYVGTTTATVQARLYQTNPTRTAASTGQTYVAALTGRIISGTGPSGKGISTGIVGEVAPSSFVNLSTSVVGGSFSEIETSTDQTVFARYTVSGSVNQVRVFIALEFVSGETIDVTYRLKLFQFELGQMPSSFIPTAGTTVTRSADVLTIPAANLPYPEPVVIGPELVTNGTFDTDSDWVLTPNVTISGGTLNFNAVDTSFISARQAFSGVVGKVYEVKIDVPSITSGQWQVFVDRATDVVVMFGGTTGSFEGVFVADGTETNIFISRRAGTQLIGSLDNISVREINPLALSIQMDGRVTYADTDNPLEAAFYQILGGSNVFLGTRLSGTLGSGATVHEQNTGSVYDNVVSNGNVYSPEINVPFNIASRHGSTFINGAVDGTALTANTTPVALPDLSASNLTLGGKYNGTIKTFRMWGQDIGDTGLIEASS